MQCHQIYTVDSKEFGIIKADMGFHKNFVFHDNYLKRSFGFKVLSKKSINQFKQLSFHGNFNWRKRVKSEPVYL